MWKLFKQIASCIKDAKAKRLAEAREEELRKRKLQKLKEEGKDILSSIPKDLK
jgi:hypothetical protein